MANTRDIRRRIKSVKNTAQITKAMQMVAASKMRKAQLAATAGMPYADLMNKVLVSLRDRVDATVHPLLEQREIKKELVLIISSDKGLCGALNTNLLREASHLDAGKTSFVATGRKGVQFLVRMKRKLLADFVLADAPSFLQSKEISKFCLDQFLSGEVDKVSVLYSQFVNTLTQKPVMSTILPISPMEASGHPENMPTKADDGGTILFEPGPAEVLDAVLPYYVHFQIYQMVLNARASEHSARMVAMKSATDNAKQLVKDLTLEYNKVRQASITSELLEISTAQMALE